MRCHEQVKRAIIDVIGDNHKLHKYMKHFFLNIQGWFSFAELYRNRVFTANENAHFVEVGAYLGCSTAFMAVEIINSGKKIHFDVVDNWGIVKCPNDKSIYPNSNWESVYLQFCKNIKPVKEYVDVYRMRSTLAARLYEPQSLDFVYIDGCHCYKCIKQDINCWLPKIKPNGVIAGHDFSNAWPGVRSAVRERFKSKFKIQEISWIVDNSTLQKKIPFL